MLIGFHPREGLVLHDIAYPDAGERRQICHRASIAELVIPYGDPNPTVHFKNVFDTGEYGMAPMTNSLALGCDCLGEIHYLDGVTNSLTGDPLVIPNAICVHEEDDNLLWKHTRPAGPGGPGALAPARDLVDRDRRQLRVRLLLVLLSGRLVGSSRPSSPGSCTRPAGCPTSARRTRCRSATGS